MNWVERSADVEIVAALIARGETPLVARLLALRGVTPETLDEFRSPKWSDLPPPDTLPGVAAAAGAVLDALKKGRKIVVFGDYDCDGLCATAILVLVLRRLAGVFGVENAEDRVAAFIPARLTEGYGLSDSSVARMLATHPDAAMIVTVDNGINAVEQIAALKARGLSVVVTDHHLPGETLPDADVVVDPKVNAPASLSELCGAAVAYFLARHLFRIVRDETGRSDVAGGLNGALLEMASLATVTDIMPLCGINRTLVYNALRDFHSRAPVGLRILYHKSARRISGRLGSKDFGCLIGPRINAVGRLGGGSEALDLLLCQETDSEKAAKLAEKIDELNESRRQIEQRMTASAMEQRESAVAAQIISFSTQEDGDSVHSGVAGIVASRMMERLKPQVPVCVLVDGKGSARAPQGYNIRDALAACSEHLFAYGGHAAAAGLGVKPGCLDAFKEAFRAECARQAASIGEDGAAEYFDAVITVSDATEEFAREVDSLGPFGDGNPEPVFALRGLWLEPRDMRRKGIDGAHLQLAFRQKSLPRVMWRGHGNKEEELRARGEAAYDILFYLRMVESDFAGTYPIINVIDMKES